MQENHLTLVCEDVAAGTSFFRDTLSLPVRQRDADHVEIELGHRTATLTAQPAGPVTSRGRAPIVDVEVPDLWAALREVRRHGATVLLEPVITDWGTESAFVAGPDGLVVELFRRRTR